MDDITTTAQIYWDTSEPNEQGWSFRYDGAEQGSGPLSALTVRREMMANDVLDDAVADLPSDCAVEVYDPDSEQVCYRAEIVEGEVINGRWV